MKTFFNSANLTLTVIAILGASSDSFSQERGATKLLSRPVAKPIFEPTWESLASQYQCPEWFRDAKFGIWAHWGPQCEPEHGDWYARKMYIPGDPAYKFHLAERGHPSTNGFKEVIRDWKAANFDPDALLGFYKECGAKYFMALANHHDNFDLFNSKHQPWNSVALGPKRDLIGDWAKAARKHGLRLGVSVHASRTWSWYEPAQDADKEGPLAGVPYDGKLTKADGKGQWWDGLDPQDLYAQNHAPGTKLDWGWDPAKGSSTPSATYMEKFFLRTKQLWDDYQPDLIYFDDWVVPFHRVTDEIGLRLAAHFYNSSIQRHGRNEAVMNGKALDETQRRALVYDIERGKAGEILPFAWQTDTCIGTWHYDREVFHKRGYKTAAQVVPMLVDIVSKNGNLMLSVPLRRDGTLDEDEHRIVSEIGAWLKVNGEAIYKTRPWKIYGEGPSLADQEKGKHGGLKDTHTRPLTAGDFRFTQSKDGKTLYAVVHAWPANGRITIRSLAENSPHWTGKIREVRMLGANGRLKFTRDANGLTITLPDKKPCEIAFALKIKS